MSSVQHLREFISQRLTAAAEEIFSEFEKTIVQYEDEIDRQRRLLEATWKPRVTLNAADSQQSQNLEEQDALCRLEKISSLDQEEPEQSQMKEEQMEPCISREEEQLVIKQESDPFMVTPYFQETNCSESETNTSQLLFQSSAVAESQDHEEDQHEGSRSGRNEEPELDPFTHTENPPQSLCNNGSANKSVKCNICGKEIRFKSGLKKHHRIHTGEKPYSCKTCGRSFNQSNHLTVHMRAHTGERPFGCQMCGKHFRRSETLTVHTRTHTREKLYSCEICGKSFAQNCTLTIHMRSHTGEKPYPCDMCGKRFKRKYNLLVHTRTHTGEKATPVSSVGRHSL
ncbi:uncharacterized protein ACNS7B_004278 [Menidia menidia]